MSQLSLDHIQKLLEERKLKPELQKETNQIMVLLEHEKSQFPLFIRIFEKNKLIQMLTFFPIECKQKHLGDVGRLLHLFNRELDVPGFGMDESSKTIFFRCMIPAIDDTIDKKLFDAYLQATQIACKSFFKPVAAIAVGAASFEELLKKAEEQKK